MAKPQQITSDNELFPIPFTILREWMGTAKPENHNYIEEFPSCYSNKFTCNEITLKVPDKHVTRWRDLLPAVCQLKTGQNVDNGSLIVTWDGVTITLNQPNKLSKECSFTIQSKIPSDRTRFVRRQMAKMYKLVKKLSEHDAKQDKAGGKNVPKGTTLEDKTVPKNIRIPNETPSGQDTPPRVHQRTHQILLPDFESMNRIIQQHILRSIIMDESVTIPENESEIPAVVESFLNRQSAGMMNERNDEDSSTIFVIIAREEEFPDTEGPNDAET